VTAETPAQPEKEDRPMPQDLLADLTPAQREAVTHTDGPLLILAAAGSGKTRVITRRVAYLLQQGVPARHLLAITFTNKAAGEMRQRVESLVPGNKVWVSTFHSLGARLLRQYADRLGLDRNFTIYDQTDRARLVKQALEDAEVDNARFTPDSIAGGISKAKNQLLSPERYASQARDFFAKTVAKVYPAYEKRLRDANALDFDDLLYWPALALKNDRELRAELDNRFRYVLIDEYQDTNHAQYQIARSLSVDHPNLCVVGDPDQCLPPGTLIETADGPRPVETLREGDRVLSAKGWGTTTFREIDKVMVNPYRGPLVVLQVEGGLTVRATPNHICFALLRPTPQTHIVYLMWKRGMGYRIGTTRGVRASKDGVIVSGLQVRANQEVADAMWILRTCPTSAEARFYEQYYSVRYGIPTMVFFVRGRRMDITQDWIDRLYGEIDTAAGADRLMRDLHLDPRYPHHRPGSVTRGVWSRRHVLFTLFGDHRCTDLQPWHYHRVQMVTSGEKLRTAASAKFSVRPGAKGTWRIETSRKHHADAFQLAREIGDFHDSEVIHRARLTADRYFPFMPAAHIHPGMLVPVCVNGRVTERKVEAVEWEDYEGPVYDLSVPETHNFVADGLVVHNSIYKFRGSDIRNILDFERDFPGARTLTLSLNYRSTRSILRAAGGLITHNTQRKPKDLVTENPAGRPVTLLTFPSSMEEAEGIARRIRRAVEREGRSYRDFAVFMRINALSRGLEQAFVKVRVPFQIVRGLAFFDRKENRDILAYLRLTVNNRDDLSFLRAVNEPSRGIGKVSLQHLQNFARKQGIPLLEAAGRVAEVKEVKGKASAALADFAAMIRELGQRVGSAPDEFIREVLDRSGYRKMLQDSRDPEDQERLANIEELITAAKQFAEEDPERTIGDFLENITLASDVDAWDQKQDSVSVMTLHASKGLEFPVVYLVAVEQGLLPHERSLGKKEDLEEERRLAFVGMTRAKEELYLCHARLREFRGNTLYAVPSMFLGEIPEGEVEQEEGASGREDARDLWRGGGEAADDGWQEAGIEPRRKGHSGRRKKSAGQLHIPGLPQSTGAGNKYKTGMVVKHPTYGKGRIVDVSGQGVLRKVKIRFQTAGERSFIADKVQLEVLGPGGK
jgi:DNA helicase-2/ATP-dependent DNA helicase PcrA